MITGREHAATAVHKFGDRLALRLRHQRPNLGTEQPDLIIRFQIMLIEPKPTGNGRGFGAVAMRRLDGDGDPRTLPVADICDEFFKTEITGSEIQQKVGHQ